jgi:YVTN family beta-propeller protein
MFSDQKMARTSKLLFSASLAVTTSLAVLVQPALATRLPPALDTAIKSRFVDARVRLDGSIETKSGDLFLPVIVPGANFTPATVKLEETFPTAKNPDLLVYSNGWFFIRVRKRGNVNTVIMPSELPEKLRKELLTGEMPGDLIVPERLVFPRALKSLIGQLAIPLADEPGTDQGKGKDASEIASAEPGRTEALAKHKHGDTTDGVVFFTSPKLGQITVLDLHTLTKETDFMTDGTPTGMVTGNGKVYISDQSKSRIIILDLNKRQITGSIPLAPKSAPKGLAILPNGKFIYVSESALNDVAVVEAATERVLMRTRVAAGPARMAVTPNGFQVIVLNVPAGEATIMSTLNQRVLGTVPVGSMPNAIVITKDSSRAFISNRMSNTISVIDITQKRVVATIPTGVGPTGLALSSNESKLYVANAKDNTIGVYDVKTRKKEDEIKLPLDVDFPGALALTPDGKHMVVSSESTEAVGIVNLSESKFEAQPVIGHTTDDILWVPID